MDRDGNRYGWMDVPALAPDLKALQTTEIPVQQSMQGGRGAGDVGWGAVWPGGAARGDGVCASIRSVIGGKGRAASVRR